jgi:hypothetical protein
MFLNCPKSTVKPGPKVLGFIREFCEIVVFHKASGDKAWERSSSTSSNCNFKGSRQKISRVFSC